MAFRKAMPHLGLNRAHCALKPQNHVSRPALVIKERMALRLHFLIYLGSSLSAPMVKNLRVPKASQQQRRAQIESL
jgi:hypothetical protein